MIAADFSAHLLVAGVLVAAVLLGAARMLWQVRRQDASARPRGWRTAALLLAQAASAALLYFVLFPPLVAREAGLLVVLTARADTVPAAGLAGEHVIALPEATAGASVANAERAPDLATALRRYPGTQRVRVLGAGLVARDRDAARGLALEFLPAPLPRGLIELAAPTHVPASRVFAVAGRARDLVDGNAELLDPSGSRVDHRAIADDGGFELHASTRGNGIATYRLRLRAADGQVVDDVAVPIVVTPARALRVLVLAGAPNAELKYLRRWALDAGMKLDARIELGAGVQVGRAPAGLGPDALDALDLLVVDERSWAALGAGQRAAIGNAVDRGLGLLLRMTAPLSAGDRQRLRALGFDASSGRAGETRLGAGFVRAGDAVDALPAISRGAWSVTAADGVVLLADARSTPLVAWRARSRGRIGVATLGDSYRLVLGGRGDAHGEVWGRSFGAVARPPATPRLPTLALAPPDQRSIICGLGRESAVEDGRGGVVALSVDPISGSERCAGFWAQADGWHVLRDSGRELPFHVPAPDAAPALQARAMAEATQALASVPVRNRSASPVQQAGPRWPWFLGWLLLASLGWWFERSRIGVARAIAVPTS
ncbi:MAG TPA: carboxypeptidase regulatory-like domain-containing protein [Lysobacter sp.]|nr:carboxypeptidase regulatory-like domain-containing protein [Lysobacter sp.]